MKEYVYAYGIPRTPEELGFRKGTTMSTQMKPVDTLMDLRNRASRDERYKLLALDAALNLGKECADLDSAMQWLETNANEAQYAMPEIDGEETVVEEVNSLLNLDRARYEEGSDK